MAAAPDDADDLIAREIDATMSVLSMQANVVKDSPEAAVLSSGSSKARTSDPPTLHSSIRPPISYTRTHPFT